MGFGAVVYLLFGGLGMCASAVLPSCCSSSSYSYYFSGFCRSCCEPDPRLSGCWSVAFQLGVCVCVCACRIQGQSVVCKGIELCAARFRRSSRPQNPESESGQASTTYYPKGPSIMMVYTYRVFRRSKYIA